MQSTTQPVSQSVGGLAPAGPSNSAVRAAAEEFEAVFIAQILHGMSAGLESDGPLGGNSEDPFSSMLNDEYARLISRSGGVGVGDAVMREMLKTQETD